MKYFTYLLPKNEQSRLIVHNARRDWRQIQVHVDNEIKVIGASQKNMRIISL